MSDEKKTCTCGCMGLGPALAEIVDRVGPSEEVRQHLRAARVEVLKGLRAMIDRQIADLSKTEQKGASIQVD